MHINNGLAKLVYKNPLMAYKYRNKIVVPPLEMVDDVLTVSKCGATSIAMNNLVNAFMSSKKLKLNKQKCAKIHIGKNHNDCVELEVQGEPMKCSEKEKYLGDIIKKRMENNMQLLWKGCQRDMKLWQK